MFSSSIDFLTNQVKDMTRANRRSITRISSSGDTEKLASLEKKTGELGKIIRVKVDNLSKRDSMIFFQNAMSFMKFQEDAIMYAHDLYTEMASLAQQAQSTSLSDEERTLLNKQFGELRIRALDLNELSFRGIDMFDQLAGSIDYDIDFGSGLFRSGGSGFKTYASIQDVVYKKGILLLDVNTGGIGEHFVFGYDKSGLENYSGELSGIVQGDPLSGIEPIFDSSKDVDFTQGSYGVRTWDTDRSAATSDFDRFLIEWGPDRDTTFRFIPLSEGMIGSGYVANGNSTHDDGIFNNRTRYLQNLVLPASTDPSNLWGLDDFEDSSFAENYGYLEDQNPEPDGSKKAIFDPDQKATIEFKGSRGDVQVSPSDPDPSKTIMQLRVNSKTIYQVRAQYFKPLTEDKEVGNVGDLNTFMKPLGLGLLRDSENKNENYPILNIATAEAAEKAFTALEKEIDGLGEQIGILANNMSRVLSSMDAVSKQLGIQQDIIYQEPEKVVSEELANLAYAREMRTFNASLMNKVVQVNHDMIDLLLM